MKSAFLTLIIILYVFTTYGQNYATGTKVEIVAVDGKTYNGTITEVLNGKYKVHYDGYDFDAWLTPDQFKVKEEKTLVDQYITGTKVEVVAVDGKTYNGTITEVLNGKYKIHYEGYDSDAWLTPDQFKVKEEKTLVDQNITQYNEYVNQGIANYNKGNMEGAINDYSLAVNLRPADYLAYYNRGLAYYKKGNYDAANSDYTNAIQFKPDYYYAWYSRGLSNTYKFNYIAALEDYNKAIELNPTNFDAYTGRGYVYLMQLNYQAAKQDYSKAISLKPDNITTYLSRAYVEFINGENDAAIADYSKTVELNADYYDGYYSRGFAYLNNGNYDASIQDFSKSAQLRPDSTNGYISLIVACIANKNFSKSKELYDQYEGSGKRSYIELKDYSFIKSYIQAATQYLVNNDYRNALPVLLTSLNEYASSRDVINAFYKYFYANILATTGYVYQQFDSLNLSSEFYQKAITINAKNLVWNNKQLELKSLISQGNDLDKTPPEIILLTPKPERGQDIDADEDAQNRVFVSGYAKDKSGIKWVKVNGVDVENLKPDGYFSSNVKDVADKLVIQAEDMQGNVEPGKEFRIGNVKKVHSDAVITPIPQSETPSFHAVLIACSKYTGAGGWPPLPTTIDEAKALKNVLMTKYGFPEKNIVELYDKTKDDITTALSSKLESLTSNDNLVILYSGHGTKEQKGSELIGYWVPLNATDPNRGYISNSALNDLIAGTKARHILIMSDACYSSAMRGNTEDAKKEEVLVPYKEEYKFESRRILTSGGLEKVPGNSKFMQLVIEALDRNTDPLLPEFYLYSLIAPGVMKSTGNLPVIQSFGKDGNHGGQFYFIRR